MARSETGVDIDGGIAQLARAIGSYPIGRGFKSNFRYHGAGSGPAIRPVGQAAKTPPFHGGNGGSIPPRVKKRKAPSGAFRFCVRGIEGGAGESKPPRVKNKKSREGRLP